MLSLPASVLIVIGGTIAAILIFSLIGLIFWLALMARVKYSLAHTEAKAAEYKARVIANEHGTWFISHPGIDIAPLHNTPYLRINGHERELTPDERFYSTLQVPHNRAPDATKMLPAIAPAVSLDLLSIFTQPTQSYAIIGGQQVGKTYQARRIASYWLQSGIKPIVIGPKWDRGEWQDCALFGGEYNFERVSQGLRIAKKLATDRHTAAISHKEHLVQPIFFDDWTAIRAKLEREAEEFIIDATTLYASVNIILYFIIHLDTANAWGVGKVGAALHRNFYKLFIETGTNEVGLVDRSKNRGFLCYPGEARKDGKRIALFGGLGQLLVIPDLVIRAGECPVCSGPLSGKQQYCSDACKQKAYRNRVTV